MPTPLDLLLSPVSLAILASYAALMLWEALAPARPLPASPGWRLRAGASFAMYFLGSSYLPLLWGATLAQWQLFNLSHLPTWVGVAVGVLVYQLLAYAWHRSMHASPRLWRAFHQMHHSAERIDTWGAFWFSPLDVLGFTAVASLALVLVVGLSPAATAITLWLLTVMAVFTHANVRTPRWLGYLVQRPESHSWHHARGRHRDNYCELPLIDLLFGTFNNPRDFAPEAGFHDGASLRVGEMLRLRDVSLPR
ncbi:sterol desaturase family protein [Arenimonas sp.]|uniref:sterol desaturase family protein n=1 Tax=Arenimonas sp. TaxID=1872635 RepID=UPI0035B078FB